MSAFATMSLPTKPFSCTKCLQSYKTPFGLRQHFKQVHKPQASTLMCQVCKKTLFKSQNLSQHKKTYQHFTITDVVVEQTKPFMCPHCNFQTNKEFKLKQHYKCKHSTTNKSSHLFRLLYQFKCPYNDCGASTFSKDTMRYHFLKVHSSQEDFLLFKQTYFYSLCKKCNLNIKNEDYKHHFETCQN